MEQRGFIHDMMDVKVLILFTMARVEYPVDVQKLYELCYQDDCLSYFDVREALPQLVGSGHLAERTDGTYEITDKGRENGALVEDSLAYPVARRVEQAVERFNRQVRRDSRLHSGIVPREGGDFTVSLELDDDTGSSLLRLELPAPTRHQARQLASAFRDRADQLYKLVMGELLRETGENGAGLAK